MDLIQKSRDFLDLIDNNPLILWQRQNLRPQIRGIPLILQGCRGRKKVDPLCSGKVLEQPGRFSGPARAKKEKRPVDRLEHTCIHYTLIYRKFERCQRRNVNSNSSRSNGPVTTAT